MFKERKEHLSSYVHVFHKTSHWDVSLCSLAVKKRNVLKSVKHVQSSCFADKTNWFLTLSSSSSS